MPFSASTSEPAEAQLGEALSTELTSSLARGMPWAPVVSSSVAHRVEMRTEHEAGKPRAHAFVAANRVAHRVERRPHARFAHPAEHRFASGAAFG